MVDVWEVSFHLYAYDHRSDLSSLVFEIMRVKAICGRCDKFGNLSLLKRDELTNPLYHYLFLKKIGLVTWWPEFLMF